MTRDLCQPNMVWDLDTNSKTITGATVTCSKMTCSEPLPVTFPGPVTDTQGFRTEQLGSDPLTIWVTMSGKPVSFKLSSPIRIWSRFISLPPHYIDRTVLQQMYIMILVGFNLEMERRHQHKIFWYQTQLSAMTWLLTPSRWKFHPKLGRKKNVTLEPFPVHFSEGILWGDLLLPPH